MSSQTSAAPAAAQSPATKTPAPSTTAGSAAGGDTFKRLLAMQLLNQGLGTAAGGVGARTAGFQGASAPSGHGPLIQGGGQMINGRGY